MAGVRAEVESEKRREPEQNKFDRVQSPEGRAGFSGLTRGVDEAGHYTFAVQVSGGE
jgi:hypothetical protein